MNRNDIKQLRETLGLSQEELGERIGVDKRTIGSWERGVNFPTKKHAGSLQAIFDGCPPPAKKKKTRYEIEEESVKRIARNIQAISRSFTEGKCYTITDNQELQNPILRYERKEGIHHVFREIHGKWIVTYTDAQLIGKKIKEVDENGNSTS